MTHPEKGDPLDPEIRELLSGLAPLGDTTFLAARVERRLRGELPLSARPWFGGRPRPRTVALGVVLTLGIAGATTAWVRAVSTPVAGDTVAGGRLGGTPDPKQDPALLDRAREEPSGLSAGKAAAPPQAVEPGREASSPSVTRVPRTGEKAASETSKVSPSARPPSPSAPTASESEARASASRLYQIATALRRDGRPDEALRLLRELQRDAPGLARAEEARALALEAHYRLGSPEARRLAEAYLDDFPSGRFRKTAENILGHSK